MNHPHVLTRESRTIEHESLLKSVYNNSTKSLQKQGYQKHVSIKDMMLMHRKKRVYIANKVVAPEGPEISISGKSTSGFFNSNSYFNQQSRNLESVK